MKLRRDSQVGGDHYAKLAVQPTYYALANGLGVCEANVVKYVSRWKNKGVSMTSERRGNILKS